MTDSFEKIPVKIFPNAKEGSKMVAGEIAQLIRDRAAKGQHCVLGMATGNTPVLLYKELVRMHREEGLSFKNVVTFNLDEYYPIHKDAYQSYWSFMHRNLFNHIDIDPANIHIPDGNWPKDEIKKYSPEGVKTLHRALVDQKNLGLNELRSLRRAKGKELDRASSKERSEIMNRFNPKIYEIGEKIDKIREKISHIDG